MKSEEEIFTEDAMRYFPKTGIYNYSADDLQKLYIAAAKRGYETGYSQGHEDQMKMRIQDAIENKNAIPPLPYSKGGTDRCLNK